MYAFLRTVSEKYGIGFWKPGSGIIHQVVLEQYAFPGGMMIGTDSHTPNAGGLGMVAIGVGGADAVDVMVGSTFGVRWPKVIGVHLTGRLSGWSSPKDVILKVAEILTVKGGTGAIVEYFGPGAETISATGRATICNMGAEIGATTSIFSYDDHAAGYLKATGREAIADAAAKVIAHLRTDDDAYANADVVFDQLIEINLDELDPMINGPHSPDLAHSVEKMGDDARAAGWPLEISSTLIGSCTNSSYEDITRTASIARQAAAAGMRVKTPLLVTPGSERVRATIERDGLLADLEAIGATVLANACGPCIGQWQRDDMTPEDVNVIVTSYNRNFPKRNDGSANTLCFVTSPETVMAFALAGTLDVDPRTDEIQGIKLDEPVGQELPSAGFEDGEDGFIAPPARRRRRHRRGRPDQRPPAAARAVPGLGRRRTSSNLPILLKAKGKCTTDHISAAGPWLKYRGHLENISGNLFLGAINAYTGAAGEGRSFIDGETHTFPDIAKAASLSGIAVDRGRRRELGRGLVARARGDGAALPRRQGDHRAQLRPHPRDQPEEARRVAAHVRGPVGVRPSARGRHDLGARPRRPHARVVGALRAAPRRRHHRRLHRQPHDERRAHRVVPGRRRPERHPAEVPLTRHNAEGVARRISSSVGVRFLRASGGRRPTRVVHDALACRRLRRRSVSSTGAPTRTVMCGGRSTFHTRRHALASAATPSPCPTTRPG